MTKCSLWIGLVATLLICTMQTSFAQAVTFRGEYFNNMALAGAPVLVRDDRNIDFDWGVGSPGANVPADNFSVRWTGTLNTNGGPYRFTIWTDDGVRLWVNNILIIDRWFDQQAAAFSADLDLPAGAVPIRMEYYENTGGASAKLYWEPTPTSPNPVGPWRGEYFNNTAVSGSPTLVRNDAAINFDWGSGSPGSGVQADRFSVRWTNSVNATAGRYRFTTTTDDGVRLWVNNNLILDKWFDQVAVWTVEVELPGGTLPIRMEYYDNLGNAVAKLTWFRVATPPPPPPPANLWRGEYFANTGLAGAPVLVRDDPAVDFDWGAGSPGGGVPSDNFSVRWTRNVPLEGGRYRFTVVVDDGVRLWVNQRLIIDKWFDQGATTYTAEIDLAAGSYPVKLEYYERGGAAVIRMGWDRIGSPPPPPPPAGNWRGEYFGNLTLSGSPAHVRMDGAINFNWGLGSPVPFIIDVDNFSVRWTQSVNLAAGRYRFTTRTDDGVRLWVNNRQIIDKWTDQPATSHSAEIDLPGGPVPVRMEYYERGGEAVAVLNWTFLGGGTPPPPVANWRGEYYANRTLSGAPVVVRSDAEINFVWANGSPGAGLPSDNFSVRWTQSVYFNQGRYRFTVRADDGVRLWVNNRMVIDLWYDQNGETSVEIDLPSGQIPIKMEYYEHAYWAEARLKWVQTVSPWVAP